MSSIPKKDIKIDNFDYDFKKFFLKPKKKSSYKELEIKIYETANKVGVWVIGFFLAYHFLKILNYLALMFISDYKSVGIIIPDYFISIVSAIIGFYFGQRFSSTKEE